MDEETLDLDTPGGRLRWARARAEFKDAAAFARAVGMKEVTYRAYEGDQNGFAKHAPDFARRLGVSTDWLLKGGPLPGTSLVRDNKQAYVAPEPDLPPVITLSRGETVELTALDLSFSMGPGRDIDEYIEEEPVQFDLGYLRRITRTAPARLRLARGVGDSMFPTLHHSDTVMIDTTQRTLNLHDRIWAISLFGSAAIKRLRPIGKRRVRIISDNPAVDDQEVDAKDLIIGGRVIWSARDL
jgi:phage repressor protein C with HTH and peptisase S24 domain